MNPMRSMLLVMAGSSTWQRLLTSWGVTRRVVAKFIPGESLDDAIGAARTVTATGMRATLNPLGENVDSAEAAGAATDTYVEIIERIAAERLDSGVSLKLTMLGLDIDPALARGNLRRILTTAAAVGVFVRVDMEASAYVDRTLEILAELRPEFPDLGAVIQTYLRRSAADVEQLIATATPIRLVKGAYAEPPEIAFPDKADVDGSFVTLLNRLASADARGVSVAVASHDPAILGHAQRLVKANALSNWEFQMLYGIGVRSQRDLAADGMPVRIYISYGPAWYPWFMRRLAERPANLLFFLRHLLG
jgi:proline dehydrogenase